MKLPKTLQIRLTLNKHENISNFKDIALPSILLIDENDKPVFCFRCSLDHYKNDSKSHAHFRRMANIDTEKNHNNTEKLFKKDEKKMKQNSSDENDSDLGKINSMDKLPMTSPSDQLKLKPKLVPNYSINPDLLETVR